MNIKPYAKAVVAGLSVAVAAAIPLIDGGLTAKECLILVGAFLAGGFPTWAIPNKGAPGPAPLTADTLIAAGYDPKQIIKTIQQYNRRMGRPE